VGICSKNYNRYQICEFINTENGCFIDYQLTGRLVYKYELCGRGFGHAIQRHRASRL